MKKILSLCAAALAVFLTPPSARAATYTWSGAGFMGNQDFLWSNPFNWNGLAAPATGETNLIIILPNNGSPRTTTNDIAGLVVKSIRFQGDNYIVAGKSPATSMTLIFDRFSGDTIEASGNNGQFASTMPLVLTNDITIDVANAKTLHIRATMGGPGGVSKLNGGTLHFNSIGNNYAGDTFVGDGILDLQCGFFGATVSVPQALVIGSTNELLAPVVRLLLEDQIADAAPVTVNANGKLWLNTFDDTVGPLTLAGGLVNTGSGGGTASPGVLTLNGNVTNRFTVTDAGSTISGKLNLGFTTRVFDVATNTELAVDADISGSLIFPPGLYKSGGGQLTFFSATNSYGGVTTVNDGVLHVVGFGSGTLLGNTNSGTVVNSNGQLRLESCTVGQEALTLNGGTNSVLLYTGTNAWAGPVTLNGNCRVFGAETFGERDDLTFSGVISGAGALTKLGGNGVLHLAGAGANTFSGGMFAADGWTMLEKGGGVAALGGGPVVVGTSNAYFPSVYLEVRSNHQIPDTAPVTVLHGVLSVENGATETLGSVEFGGGWIISFDGALTLNGNLTNRADSEVSALYGPSVLAPGTHFFHADAGTQFDAFGALNGSGALTKTGPGALTLHSTNSYAGLTLVKNGFLKCSHNGRPGSSAAGTEVEAAGVLALDRTSFTNESLTLHGHPVNYSIYVRDVCSWIGGVSLLADAGVQFEIANGLTNKLTFNGGISGAGGLRSDGEGELALTGSTDNTFAGPLWFRTSNGRFQKTSGATAVSSSLVVGRDLIDGNFQEVTLGANNQIANSAPVRLNASGEILLGNFNETVGNMTLAGGDFDYFDGLLTLNGSLTSVSNGSTSYVLGRVSLGGATRTFDLAEGGNVYFNGVIEDGGSAAGITKTGAGFLRFSEPNTYAGPTLISEGPLELAGAGRPGSAAGGTEIAAGARLELTGSQVTNEALVLHGTTVFYEGTNEWRGPINLNGLCQFWAFGAGGGTNESLLVDGTVTGLGSLSLRAGRKFTLAGSAANTFNGVTTLERGTLELKKTSGFAIPGSLVVGGTNIALEATVQTAAADQFNSGAAFRHTYHPSGQLNCGGFDQRVPKLTLIGAHLTTLGGVLALDGDVTVGRANQSASALHGTITLGSVLASAATRTLTISNQAGLSVYDSVRNGVNTSNLWQTGGGHLHLYGSNSFSGLFTIEDGTLHAGDSDAFGQPGGGTLIKTNGRISLNELGTPARPVAEPFTFEDTEPGSYSLLCYGTNRLGGPLVVQGNLVSSISSFTGSNALLVLSGPVSGNGASWQMEGNGLYRITGTNDNTFSGALQIYYADLELSKTNAVAITGPLIVGGELDPPGTESVRWLRPNQIADTTPVTVRTSGRLELLGHDEAIGSLAGDGQVALGLGTLTTGVNDASTTFAGVISGIGGKLTKAGAGTFTLTTNNTYTGVSTVFGGTLLVHGHQPSSAVSLLTGGTVGGNGRVGAINALNGHVAPGASPGKLSSSGLSFFNPAGLLKIEINGTNAGVTFDQVDVTGSVLLMGGGLGLAMNIVGAVSNQYLIVQNDGGDSVSGTFTGLPEGGSVTNNGVVFSITYLGGDGNDIVLVQQTPGVGPHIGGIQWQGGGRVALSALGVPNTTYTVEATDHLNAPIPWQAIGTALAGPAGALEFTDNDAANHTNRFYRFRLP